MNSPILLHPQLLHPILPIQKSHNTFIHRLQVLGSPGRNLDGQSRTSHDCEVMPRGFVGVLDCALLVEDLGTANVELLDFDGEGTVSGLGFFDGDIVFFLRSVHVQNMRLPQHIPHNHILGLPLTRTRRSFRTVIIILDHTLPLRLHNLDLLVRNIKLHDHGTCRRSDRLDGLVGLIDFHFVHLEENVAQTNAGGVGGASVDSKRDHRTFTDGLDVGIGSSLVQSRTQLFRGGEDGTEHGCGDTCLVVLPSRGQAAIIQGDGGIIERVILVILEVVIVGIAVVLAAGDAG
mmetsp:Transcript_18758/g.30644  ORF Transcript_18758/g.30644 Transcript_18758/m.30644 type:complete len:290 (-) Transcript_18758:205-1074(-)